MAVTTILPYRHKYFLKHAEIADFTYSNGLRHSQRSPRNAIFKRNGLLLRLEQKSFVIKS